MVPSLDPQRNDTSTTLDLVRFLAAFAVLLGHGISFFGVAKSLQPPSAVYMQNMGVLVFFVLSGFLIAFVLNRAQARGTGMGDYLVDRFARIYSGFVPAMVLVGLLDWWMVSNGVHEHPQYATPTFWLGNLAMLNGYPDMLIPVSVPNFGSAGQLWTLAVEFHLYIFIGALFFLAARPSVGALLLAIAFASVPLSYLSFARAPGAGIVWLWLLGFATFYAARSRLARLPMVALVFATVVLTALAWRVAVPGREYDGKVYVLLAAAFVFLVLLTQKTHFFRGWPRVRACIKYCADFSFTLYLVHYTVLYLTHRLIPGSGWTGFGISVAASLALSILLAHLGERHHKALARKLKLLAFSRPRYDAAPRA